MKFGNFELEPLAVYILFILLFMTCVFYFEQKEKTAQIVSCNNLKAAALAASAPEPQCAK